MKNYREAQEIINKEFPEFMELRLGCEIWFKIFCQECSDICGDFDSCRSFESDICSFTVGNEKEVQPFDYMKIIVPVENDEFVFYKNDLLKYEKGFAVKVLGQPITLQSLLRYLDKTKHKGLLGITTGGLMLTGDGFTTTLDLSKDPKDWDWDEILKIIIN